MTLRERWKSWARAIQRETLALYFVYCDPGTPWYAKVLAICIVGYALSPIDLISDFIPILGHLDDLLIIPLAILLVRRLVPPVAMEACRARAAKAATQPSP